MSTQREKFMSMIESTTIARSMLGTMFEMEGHEFLARDSKFVSRFLSKPCKADEILALSELTMKHLQTRRHRGDHRRGLC